MKLRQHDQILSAFPEYISGPGWSNSIVWVIIRDYATGKIRQECIQPEDQTRDIAVLFDTCAAAHHSFRNAVINSLQKKG